MPDKSTETAQEPSVIRSMFGIIVIIAALGYFVDIYDLILVNIVRNSSLKTLCPNLSDIEINKLGAELLNMQMYGMLVGGIIWGILGDKKGRISVLFGSIILYSIANIANGFVTDITTYSVIRFFAGVGLAGELGAGITLVSESMDKEYRGYGTMLIVSFGALGAVLAGMVATTFSWQIAYFVGGGLGLLLLILRIGAFESGMYKNMSAQNIQKGAFLSLFTDWKKFKKYFAGILIGLPIWFIISIPIAMSKVLAKELGVTGDVDVVKALMFSYVGLSLGDLISGVLSQVLRSRKKVVLIYLGISAVLILTYFFSDGVSAQYFYALSFFLGAGTGFWALFVTIASEQFGTNIRATVTTTTPNFVRGAVPLITFCFFYLARNVFSGDKKEIYAGLTVGFVTVFLSLIATLSVKETFGKDLQYLEQ